jgi:hypothetical protein
MNIEDNEILKDGERLRVPFTFMDSAAKLPPVLHRPGYVDSGDATVNAVVATKRAMAYDAYDKRITNAWRADKSTTIATADTREACYAAHDRYKANAWRGAR